MRRIALVAGGAALVAAGLLLLRGGPRTPADEIRALLAEAETAANERDPGGIIEAVGPGYRDARGLDRDALRAYLAAQLLGGRWTGVLLGDLDVRVDGPRAEVETTAVLARTAAGLEARRWHLSLRLVREGGDWHIVWADWRPL